MDKVSFISVSLYRCIVDVYIYLISICPFGDGAQYRKKTRPPCPMKKMYRLPVKCDGLALNLPRVRTIILIYR